MITFSFFLAKLVPDCPAAGCNFCNLIQLGGNIIDFLIKICAVLVVIFIIYGGVKMMISSGSPEKIKESQGIIWSAIIGLIISLASWLILNTFFHLITGELNWPWDEIQC